MARKRSESNAAVCPPCTCVTAIWAIRIVVHPVGWVRDHEMRSRAIQQAGDIGGGSGIAAEQTMLAQQPEIAGAGDGLADWQFHAVMLFAENVGRWIADAPLQNICDPALGY